MYKAPSKKLTRELQEVATAARRLSELARSPRPNMDLASFPVGDVAELCETIAELVHGTAEGCREPLIYSRRRLSSIRRLHLLSAVADDVKDDETQEVPQLSRGDILDDSLIQLIGAISTALDQYQSDAHVELADEYPPNDEVSLDNSQTLKEAVRKSRGLELSLRPAIKTTSELSVSGVTTADSLERQLRDTATHNHLARSELSRKGRRSGWYEPLIAQLQKMPDIIEQTGLSVQKAVTRLESGLAIVKPVLDRWKNFKQNALDFLLNEIRETGASLQEVGAEMKALKQEQHDEVRIEDFNPRLVEEMIVSGKAPPRTWTPRITLLNFNYYASFSNLTPLKNLKALRELTLMNTLVDDLTPLSGLTRLEYLDLSFVYTLSDLKPLERLRALQILKINRTRVRNISPIAGLPKLETVYIDGDCDFVSWEKLLGRTGVLKIVY